MTNYLTTFDATTTGECGEVCEIFQWKGTLFQDLLDNNRGDVFSEEERVHIGEEIADVFIYTTRLSDVCAIDLSTAVRNHLKTGEKREVRCAQNGVWQDDVTLDDLCRHSEVLAITQAAESQRSISLQLQAEVGKVTHCFSQHSEGSCLPGLPHWKEVEVETLATSLAAICLLLCALAQVTKILIGQVLADKFAKNEAKYPVHLAKGSSAKYTAYSKKGPTTWSTVQLLSLLALVGAISFTLGTRYK
eukprot:scaffold3700_cov189-Ochromonas_danica.AAC.2